MDCTSLVDAAAIRRACDLLFSPGQVFECRIIEGVLPGDRRSGILSGYFNDIDKLVAAVASVRSAQGFYITLNPANPALLARAANRIRAVGKEPTTADHDVVGRNWLPIDFDAKRPAGISATDSEHDAAIALAYKVRATLAAEGWPDSIVADSGNGAHLLYRIDLPRDDEGLVKRCLESLAQRFSSDTVKVDAVNHNPARIWKLYGTKACKGDDTPEMPHRMAKILEAPDIVAPVSADLLSKMAGPAAPVSVSASTYSGPTLDLEAWIQRHDLEVDGPQPWEGGRKWIFKVCPWNSDHTNRSAYVAQRANGAAVAGCRHDGCKGNDWHKLRAMYEPERQQFRNTNIVVNSDQSHRRVELGVAACNGSSRRLVVAMSGGQYHRDELNVNQSSARKRFIAELSEKLKVPASELSHLDNQLVAEADQADQKADEAAGKAAAAIYGEPHDADEPPEARRERLLADTPATVKAAAQTQLESPDLFDGIVDDFRSVGVAGERELAATLYLVGTSRLLGKPLAAIVQGQSASGKSYTIECIARMFPPEAVVVATSMTPQSLFHMPAGSLVHRWVVAGERSRMENDERAEATRALREIISAGRLSKLMAMKIAGEIKTRLIVQDGPIAFVESTTLGKIFDEDANRCLLLSTDERPEQTKRIVKAIGEHSACAPGGARSQEIIDQHHTMQRMLLPYTVRIPFAQKLAEIIAHEKVETRRAFPQLISAVEASALLHQFQRTIDDEGRLVAASEDYELARTLLLKPLGRLLGGKLSDPAARFAERLATWATDSFTSRDAAKHETANERSVRGWLSELHEAGLIEVIDPPRGPKPATWRLTGASIRSADQDDLPAISELLG